jgi:6-phosphogluconolactonase
LSFSPDGQFLLVTERIANNIDAFQHSARRHSPIVVNTNPAPGTSTLAAGNCWNAITPDGTKIYTSNSGSDDICGFNIGKNGTLTPIGGTVVDENPTGSHNVDIAITAHGKYLYTINSQSGNIGMFAINQDGSLTELGQAGDLPRSVGFNGIAAF